MNGADKSALTDLYSSERARDFLLLMGIGLFMAAVGAFDTDGAHPIRRLTYWVGLMMAGGGAHRILSSQITNSTFAKGVWIKGALLTALMTIALTPIVWLASMLLFGAEPSTNRLLALVPGVLVVNTALVALLGVTQHRPVAPPPSPISTNTIPDKIRDLLPAPLRQTTMLALHSEDHYVRVYMNEGTALIRITMRDAIEALDPALGFQTHRSWWVNETSIRDIRWKRGQATLRLENDIEVPVSRTFAKHLKAEKRL